MICLAPLVPLIWRWWRLLVRSLFERLVMRDLVLDRREEILIDGRVIASYSRGAIVIPKNKKL
jgi:hypothetical protein